MQNESIDKPKLIIITGPTATGKSDFAVRVALQLRSGQAQINAEIISADSRQVYKGLDIGSGKITETEMQGVPHHLLDITGPQNVVSVDQYKRLTHKKIKEITERGNVPIICGGTGFYIDAVTKGMSFPEVPPNEELRTELEQKTTEELFAQVASLDSARTKTIDAKNRVRLIRAIEIATALGHVPEIKSAHPYDTLFIGLDLPDEVLKEKISIRLFARISPMLEEIKNLNENGLSWKRMIALGLEYRYGAMCVKEKISQEEMISKLQTEIWKYAKRQRTWFKRNKKIVWIDPRETNTEVIEKIKSFLEKSNF
ncbi:MAG: tRNA (adenosine(37)-N6)-dimethylallyltransferase MiaA [bacterium]